MHSITFWSLFAISISLFATCGANNLELKFQWKTIDFEYESAEKRQEAIENQTFIPANVIPIGLDIYKDRLFLSLPRLKHGVPVSLAYINLTTEANKKPSSTMDGPANLPSNDASNAPTLKPYPNWAAHKSLNPNDVPDIVSPFHIKVDRCGRLWAIDTGIDGSIDILHEKEPEHLADPRILIYNLTDDTLIRTYKLSGAAQTTSIYSNIVIDDTDTDCDNVYAFVAGAGANKPHLIVYSLKLNDSWTIEHNFFHLDPLAGNFSVLGIDYQTSDALYGLALTEKKSDGYPELFFHALTSYREFKVSTSVLRNRSLFGTGQGKYYKKFIEIGTRGTNEQAGTSAYDKMQKVIFYTLPNKNEVACWRVSKKENYAVDNVFSSPGYPFDVKVDDQHQIWILSNNIHRFLNGDLSGQNTANFFIHSGPVNDLIDNTKCEPGFIDKLKQKLSKGDSTVFRPTTLMLFITSFLLSLKHLF